MEQLTRRDSGMSLIPGKGTTPMSNPHVRPPESITTKEEAALAVYEEALCYDIAFEKWLRFYVDGAFSRKGDLSRKIIDVLRDGPWSVVPECGQDDEEQVFQHLRCVVIEARQRELDAAREEMRVACYLYMTALVEKVMKYDDANAVREFTDTVRQLTKDVSAIQMPKGRRPRG
jgi:hypothetical protein